jgi:CSLREA domain-containing protein
VPLGLGYVREMPRTRGISGWWVAVLLAVVFGLPAAAHAATITVTTTTDEVSNDGACSLREAITAVDSPPGAGDCAAADGGTNTIVLPAGRYRLTITGAHEDANATGDLDVGGATSGLTIQGAGAGLTLIDGAGLGDRVLDIAAGAPSVALTALTITDGHAPDGIAGAFGNGTNGGNGTAGEDGGGIRSHAPLSLTDAAVVGNQAGAGGPGGSSIPGFLSGNGGAGGGGGGIATTGALTLVRTSVSGNRAGAGGAGAPGGAGNGGGAGNIGGAGGGIDTSSDLVVTDSAIAGNGAGDDGAGGDGGPDFPGGSGHGGGGGPGGSGSADGGGIELSGGSATISGSTISGNSAGDGGKGGKGGDCSGPSTFGGPGGSGGFGSWGGAINAASAQVTLTNSTLAGNFAGNGGAGGAGGSGGFGAGMTGGTGGNGGNGSPGGNGGGFALAGFFTSGSFVNVTDAQNGIGTGGAAGAAGAAGDGTAGSPGSAAGAGVGGGVYSTGTGDDTTLANTIVASNGGSSCSGSVQNGGGDLGFCDSSCPGTVGDPRLSELRDNGGGTQTMALLPGSAALDRVAASGAGCPATDQRGIVRPQPAGGMCDIGAYEFTPPSCAPVAAAGESGQPASVQLNCTDPAGAALTYTIDSQPAHGALGAIDQAAGRVTYSSAPGYSGADSFTYHAESNNGTTASVTATLAIAPAATRATASIRKLTLSPTKFRSAAHGGSVARAHTGTRVTYVLSAAASVRFTVARPAAGKRGAKGRCLAPKKAKRHARRCTRLVKLRGGFTRAGKAGTNRFRFTGRLRGRRLRAGRYRLLATPPKPGRARSVAFRIVR